LVGLLIEALVLRHLVGGVNETGLLISILDIAQSRGELYQHGRSREGTIGWPSATKSTLFQGMDEHTPLRTLVLEVSVMTQEKFVRSRSRATVEAGMRIRR